MRIMHIASGDKWAGAEVQVWTLCAELVRQQHEVYAVIMNPGRLAAELEKAGVKVTVLDESQYSFWQLLGKLKAELRRVYPEVVHTHRQKENILGALANRLTINAKSFRTVHGAPEFAPSAKQKMQIAMDQFCGKYLQHGVISVDNELTEKLKGIYPAGRIHTIANGISTKSVCEDAASNKVEPLDKAFVHIGLVGRLEPVKRVDLFLQAAALLKQDSSLTHSLIFHVFGDGSLADNLKTQAVEAGISEQVIFHGHTDSVRSWIAQMDYLMMTSDHEGLPMTALESLALGTPMIAHATGGLKPLLQQAFPEGLVYQHSAQGYYEGVLRALKQPDASARQIGLPAAYEAANNAKQCVAVYTSAQ